jgi:chromobox protein 1/chromobox protein 5
MSKEDYYEIDQVLDYKVHKHKKYYLIKWKGYSSKDNTWEPFDNLKNVLHLIDQFHQ